jgi:hypothetical protein
MMDATLHSVEEIFHLLEVRNFKNNKYNEKNKKNEKKIEKYFQSVESDIENYTTIDNKNRNNYDDADYIDKMKFEYEIKLNILEIYNEKIIDLLEDNFNDGNNSNSNNDNVNNEDDNER